MRLALIADTYPPLRSSGAVQLRDLAQEAKRQGHEPTVLVPSSDIEQPWQLDQRDGIEVLTLRAPKTKDINYFRRTLSELVMPFAMLRGLRKSPLANTRWDGIAWYSPTIFLGPIVKSLKKSSGCRAYLILRDIFPQWAVDMGLMGRGLPYWFFKMIERQQYAVADVIGIQTPANMPYFDSMGACPGQRVEVLQNWLADASGTSDEPILDLGSLRGRTVFVYAGNLGVAQGVDIFVDLAMRLQSRRDIGFLFVGRGSEARRLQSKAESLALTNVVFNDEIDPAEIPAMLAQCHVGIVALDPRHKTHNIPGKFLTYLRGGLLVLANINPGNDLVKIVNRERIGCVCTDNSLDTLENLALELVSGLAVDEGIAARCRALFNKEFSPQKAVQQITAALAARES